MEMIPLKLSYDFNGQIVVIYPSLIIDRNMLWLVDCGYEGSLDMIRHQLALHHVDLTDLVGIIISHDDIDHLGGLKEIKDVHPGLRIVSSEIESPYVSGSLRSLRLLQAEELFPGLPEEHRTWALSFQAQLRSIKRVQVDDVIPFDGELAPGIQIINTPGHTPGHISIYLPDLKTLIANDAIVFENGQLGIANPEYCLDLPAAVNSVRKLATLSVDTLYCYHGGIVKEGVAEMMNDLVGRLDKGDLS